MRAKRIQGIIAELPDNLTVQEKQAIAENCLEIEKALGITKGKRMSVEDADQQHANPNWGKSREYSINCQTCAPAYVLRLLGFDITAKPNTKGLNQNTLLASVHLKRGLMLTVQNQPQH